MIGILLPAAIIFAKERLNNKILFRSDIENVLTIPIIGEVFETKIAESELVFVENSRSVIAESIRAIRTKLPFYFTHETEKVLLISSSIPGEGKSFIAANLGLSMALMGKRTLLIGGDMRKPRIHKAFDVSNAIGLSTFLIGKCQVEDTLFGTEHENLYVLPSGPIPPNPSELLMGERFQKLMVNLRVEFDFIILDTPPLGLISDPELMVKEADLSLFVVRHNHSLKEAIRKVLGSDDFRQRFPRTVVVFNGLKQRGVGYYGYGYGLGYGYGYGNGDGPSYGSEVKRATVWKRIKRIFKMPFKKKS
jgi:capsular exopolysaccharide synthesis family protein